MKKKSCSWSAPGSRWGGRPWLISWAAVVIIERAAWRKIWVEPDDRRRAGVDQVLERLARADRRQLVGVADEDDVGRLGQAAEQHLGQAQVEHRGLVDDRPGRPAAGGRARSPARGRASTRASGGSSVASWPVASSRRRAARPVGAQSAIVALAASASATISLVQPVLPTPGPPVSTETRAAKAPCTAAHCSSVRRPRRLAGGSWSRWAGAAARRASVAATASSLARVGSR